MDNKEMEMIGLDPEDMERISGGHMLPGSEVNPSTRRELIFTIPPKEVDHRLTIVEPDGTPE